MDQRDVVEGQVPIFQVKTVLGKIESLINEIEILISHRGDFCAAKIVFMAVAALNNFT